MRKRKENKDKQKEENIETIPEHFKTIIKKDQSPIDFRIQTMKRILDGLHLDF